MPSDRSFHTSFYGEKSNRRRIYQTDLTCKHCLRGFRYVYIGKDLSFRMLRTQNLGPILGIFLETNFWTLLSVLYMDLINPESVLT